MKSQRLSHALVSWVVALVVLAFPCIARAAGGDVVVLHSVGKATSWTDELKRGLALELGDSIGISQTYLGSGMEDDEYFDSRFSELAEQWGKASPVAVVTDGPVAFGFMRKYREEIFTGSPVIYCAMPRPDPEFLRQCGECTGLPMAHDVAGTLKLIFTLRPRTTTVVGIMDGSPESRALRQKVEAAMEPYAHRAQIVFPGHEPGDDGGLDFEKVRAVASSVPRSGSVLFLGFAADNAGNPVDGTGVVSVLADRSAGPVYVLSDEWMQKGVLGGSVVSGVAQGREVARMVRRIQTGESAQGMLPDAVVPHPLADLTVLARFGIPADLLPPKVVAVNAPDRPEEPVGITSTGLAAAGAGVIALIALYVLLRRAAGRKDT